MKKDNYTRLENVIQFKEEFKMDNGNLNLGKKNMEEQTKDRHPSKQHKNVYETSIVIRISDKEKKILQNQAKNQGRVFSGYIRDRLFNRTGEDENILAYNDLCRTLYDLSEATKTEPFTIETELREGISKTIDFFNKNKKKG